MQKGQILKGWKGAHITALHKKGNKSNPENYRPISLTLVCGNIMESLIRDSMVAHMVENIFLQINSMVLFQNDQA